MPKSPTLSPLVVAAAAVDEELREYDDLAEKRSGSSSTARSRWPAPRASFPRPRRASRGFRRSSRRSSRRSKRPGTAAGQLGRARRGLARARGARHRFRRTDAPLRRRRAIGAVDPRAHVRARSDESVGGAGDRMLEGLRKLEDEMIAVVETPAAREGRRGRAGPRSPVRRTVFASRSAPRRTDSPSRTRRSPPALLREVGRARGSPRAERPGPRSEVRRRHPVPNRSPRLPRCGAEPAPPGPACPRGPGADRRGPAANPGSGADYRGRGRPPRRAGVASSTRG